jgi:ubiquinone/menaquinone biosynthesis C-methylase UbiE
MLDRRHFLSATTAAAGFLAAGASARAANAAQPWKGQVDVRGTVGRLKRLGLRDLESQQDFLTSFRGWVNNDFRKAAQERADLICARNGVDPKAPMAYESAAKLFESDPIVAGYVRAWVSNQIQTWGTIQTYFHDHADMYLSEMEAADRQRPGSLELAPTMYVPDYTKHEIHIQPGGYTGDEFAGYINFYGVNNFYAGKNYQDEAQFAIAAAMPLPKDGKVKRILDMGCATGRLTMALKQRFPDAEVWGIDVGGPMVRFAHVRGLDLGLDVHYAQRLAEDTKFPDGYFDVVASYILFHEVQASAAKKIAAEAHRVLRPGGTFFPVDFPTGRQAPVMSPYTAFSLWWDHRWNNEVWSLNYRSLNFADEMAKVGFAVDETVPQARRGHGRLLGTKLT